LNGFNGLTAIACCLVCLLLPAAALADISVEARVSKDRVKLGEQFKLRVDVTFDPGYQIEAPRVGAKLGDSYVVGRATHNRKTPDGRSGTQFEYTLAVFKLKRATIASVAVIYTDLAGKPGRLVTEPIGISVVGTVPKGAMQIKDIKDMFQIRPRMALWLKVLIGFVALLVAAAVIWRLAKGRKRPEEERPAEKAPPASVVALSQLERLVESDLLFNKKYKEFYFALSQILRRFLSRRLGFAAEDMTTTEIEFSMRDNPISPEFTLTVIEVLRFSDMVKFAKFLPSDTENEEMIRKARSAIEQGREPLFSQEALSGQSASDSTESIGSRGA